MILADVDDFVSDTDDFVADTDAFVVVFVADTVDFVAAVDLTFPADLDAALGFFDVTTEDFP